MVCPPRIDENSLNVCDLLHSRLAIFKILICKLEIKFFYCANFDDFRQVHQLILAVEAARLALSLLIEFLLFIFLLLHPRHDYFKNIAFFLPNLSWMQSFVLPETLRVFCLTKQFELLGRSLLSDYFGDLETLISLLVASFQW